MDFSNATAKTEDVFNVLAEAAREMRTIEYGEISSAVGLPAMGMGRQLGFIRDACSDRGLPWLPVIAVNRNTGLPSGGVFVDVEGMDGNVESPAFAVWWRAMVLHVFATNWSRF